MGILGLDPEVCVKDREFSCGVEPRPEKGWESEGRPFVVTVLRIQCLQDEDNVFCKKVRRSLLL